MQKLSKFLFPASLFLPLLASAQNIEGAIETVRNILSSIVPIIMILALIYFFYGLAKYILAAGSEESKAEGRNIMIYGVIALFVMASVWGLVTFLQDTFGVNEGTAPVVTLPDVVR